MSKKRRNKRADFYSDHYWESSDYNFLSFQKNFDMLLTLAINRFRWVNMPETCDARFFERQLHRTGVASFAHKRDDSTPVFCTLTAMPTGTYNMYGIPTKWRSVGYDGLTEFETDSENGSLCYYANSRITPWNMLEIYARRLTSYERTEDVNLTHQKHPWMFVVPPEKRMEVINLFKQIDGNEAAVFGSDGLYDVVKNITTLDLKVPLIVEELGRAWQNTLNQALLYLGIPHLAFEKGERMIEDEARANSAPTNIMLLDCLASRRKFCEETNKKFGLDMQVYFNDDWESYNFNYLNNIESQAQDGLLENE